MTNIDLILFIIFIIFLYCLYSTNKSKNEQENYINYKKYQNVYNNCFDYLLWNGSKFLLLKIKNPIIKNKNPLEFNNYNEVESYLNKKHQKCTNIQFVNLVETKSGKDPIENPEWECSRELNLNRTSDKEYQIQKCMFQKILDDNYNLLNENEKTRNNSNEMKFMKEIDAFF